MQKCKVIAAACRKGDVSVIAVSDTGKNRKSFRDFLSDGSSSYSLCSRALFFILSHKIRNQHKGNPVAQEGNTGNEKIECSGQ